MLAFSDRTSAQDTPHVAVVHVDPSAYAQVTNDGRAAAARSFFATHSDSYDFLVMFPAFAIDRGAATSGETLGRHWMIRNDVSGIGLGQQDVGTEFGSARRLKGLIDVHSLVPGVEEPGFDAALAVLAHETAHQWSSYVKVRDPRTGQASTALLGRDSAHWSYFLDSDSSVMYGSDWRDAGDGRFVADASLKRYSPLDLYLMGILDASEVPQFSLLVPAPGSPSDPTALPPLAGTSIVATALPITIGGVIATEGPRAPGASASQKVFRAAFAIVTPDGVEPTLVQRGLVDAVRREWANRFFFMTRGRAVMETDLLEAPPRAVAESPSVAAALGWLLSAQRPDGSWYDGSDTRARETQEALEALRLFAGDDRVPPALQRGAASLPFAAVDADTWARGVLASRAAGAVFAPGGAPRPNADGGYGLAAGYGSTVLDAALVGIAARTIDPGANVDPLVQWLIASQGGDGGWSLTGVGPSTVAGTSLALELLARVERTAHVGIAAEAGVAFLLASRLADFTYGDEHGTPAETSMALLALDAWQSTVSVEDSSAALLSMQAPDGSWGGSAHETALALRAIRALHAPNLAVAPESLHAQPADVTEGEHVTVLAHVFNIGRVQIPGVSIGLYASDGTPLAPVQSLPSFSASYQVQFDVDTFGRAGLTQAFVVVDPAGTVDETTKQDNRAAVALIVRARPAGADPYAAAPVVADPPSVSRLPTQLTVRAVVGNLGLTDAATDVALIVGDVRAATTRVTLAAGVRTEVSLTATLANVGSSVPIAVQVNPDGADPDANPGNDRVTATVPVVPTLDLVATGISAVPSVVEQGRDIELVYTVENRGTIDAGGAAAQVRVLDAGGALVADVGSTTFSLARGTSATYRARWRASVSGALVASVQLSHPDEADRSNDAARSSFQVQPSTTPNLAFVGQPVVDPDPPLVGNAATVRATIVNRGGGAAGPFAAELRVGPSDGPATTITHVEFPGLAAGGTVDLTGTFTPSDAATRSVVALADTAGQVAELDESDNAAVRSVDPLPLPDLIVGEADVTLDPSFPKPGETVAVAISVYNAGGQTSATVPVDLYLGEPGAGARIASATLNPLAARTRSAVTLTWPTQGLSGSQLVVAVVDGGRTGVEQRWDNNVARRTVSVQSGAVVANNPYFSPNADGVKDTTEITWRTTGTAASDVRIAAAEGGVVRAAPLASGATSFTWDGSQDAGGLARDGAYRVEVRAAGGALVGSANVVIDTNSIRFDDSEHAAWRREVDLSAAWGSRPSVPTDRYRFAILGVLPDEKDVLLWQLYGDGGARIARQPLLGGPPEPLPLAWPPLGDSYSAAYTASFNFEFLSANDAWKRFERYAVSADGARIALAGRTPSHRCTTMDPCTYPYQSVPNCNGYICGLAQYVEMGEPRVVLLDLTRGSYDIIASAEDDQHAPILVQFTPDGSRILFGSTNRDYNTPYPEGDPTFTRIFSVAAASIPGTTPVRLLEAELPGTATWFRVSPDGTRIGALIGGAFWVVALDGTSASRQVIAPANVGGARRFEWLPDGAHVVLFAPRGPSVSILDVEHGVVVPQPLMPPPTPPAAASLTTLAVSPSMDAVFLTAKYTAWESPIYVAEPPGSIPRAVGSPFMAGVLALSQRGTAAAIENSSSGFGKSIVSLANLTATLRASKPAGATSVAFRGTAADLNLDDWSIAVRPYRSTAPAVVVAHSRTPVIDGPLTSWMPPGPGLYEATLTVRDLAGNVTSDHSVVPWSESSLIANLRVEPALFSPNGDRPPPHGVGAGDRCGPEPVLVYGAGDREREHDRAARRPLHRRDAARRLRHPAPGAGCSRPRVDRADSRPGLESPADRGPRRRALPRLTER